MPKKSRNIIKNKISIIGGGGHIGLPLAVKFAENNFKINIIFSQQKIRSNLRNDNIQNDEIWLVVY